VNDSIALSQPAEQLSTVLPTELPPAETVAAAVDMSEVPLTTDALLPLADVLPTNADSLASTVPADTIAGLMKFTDFLQPFTDPLYPLVAHLQVPPTAMSPGTLPDYAMRSDNIISMLLLGCFVLLMISLRHSLGFIARQAKEFFTSNEQDSIISTSNELLLQSFMVLMTCLLLSVGINLLATADTTVHYTLSDQLSFLPLLFAICVAYFFAKWVVYMGVNVVFFGGKKSLQWSRVFFFINGIESLLLFPLIMLLVYFDMAYQKILICFILVLFLNKALLFYKSHNIFFKENGGLLQNFLYLCTLEIAPLLALVGAFRMAVELFEINF